MPAACRSMASPSRTGNYPDQIHGFLSAGKIIRAAVPALDDIAAALRAAWGEGPALRAGDTADKR